MFDTLLNLVFKATSVQPDYVKSRCIAAKQSASACSICKDVCPHEAITFKRNKEVVIDDIDCTGCGICVQSCPSQALESKVSYQRGAPLKCSQVKGGAQTVQCLGRLGATDMLRLAGSKNKVTLVRGDCADCKIGTAQVPDFIEQNVDKARALATLNERELGFTLIEESHYDATDNPDVISRRDLLRGGWRGVQNTASDALAPLDPGGDDDNSLPKEQQSQYRALELAELPPEKKVPWILPRVADGCIMCPVCTNVCPTGAFHRDFKPEGREGTVLVLEPERCNGCNACVPACPTKVITLDEGVTWAELSGGSQEAFYKDPREGLGESVSR